MVLNFLFIKQAFKRFSYASICTVLWIVFSCLVAFCNPILGFFTGFCTEGLPFFTLLSKISTLGIPLFISFQLVFEKYFNKFPKFWIYSIGIMLLGLYFFSAILTNRFIDDPVFFQQQFYLFFFLLILLVSFVSFFRMSMHSFWKFNNILLIKLFRFFVRCLVSIFIYVFMLYVLDYFFSLDIKFYLYQIGMIIIIGMLGCLNFLSEIPKDLDSLEEETPYPKFYYLISSLYFLPTSILFILIGYIYFPLMYFFKFNFHIEITIFTILGSGFGLFFLLQMELLRTRTKNKFTLFFLKYFYWVILPLLICNFIYVSLDWLHQGITEFWYIFWLCLFWGICICVYFNYSKRRDIRLIPMSLFILFLVIVTGPFMPFNVACNSQFYQLKSILSEEGLITNNLIQFNSSYDMSSNHQDEVKSILNFLNEHRRLVLIKKIYPYSIASESLTLRRLYDDLNLE